MDVTAKLLRVFLVDKQIRGLTARLGSAEKFLGEQVKQLGGLTTRRSQIESQLRVAQVAAAEREGEMKRLDVKIATLKEQMNSSQTNKEYKAFLTEINTFKADRDAAEKTALEQMTKVDDLKKQLGELDSQKSEREQVRQVATDDRQKRSDEIRDRLNELNADRVRFVAEVPGEVMTKYSRALELKGEDAMAAVEIQDRKRHEFTCGSCMMSLPVEVVSGLLSTGKLAMCPCCQCFLYLEKELVEAMQPAGKR